MVNFFKVFLPIVKISIQDFPSISFSIFQQRKIICKASCFQYHNCSCVVNLCAKIIFNQRERNFATELKQGRIFNVFYGLQRYFANLYIPIGINFLYFEVFPRHQFNLPCELLMCVTCWWKLYHSLSIGPIWPIIFMMILVISWPWLNITI